MDAPNERPDEAEGLKLIRAFLSLPPGKRAEVIAFAERLARPYGRPVEEGANASPNSATARVD